MTTTASATKTLYVPIKATDVPAGVRFDVPKRNQGQSVEVAWGGFGRYEHSEGDDFKRVTDFAEAQGFASTPRFYKAVR